MVAGALLLLGSVAYWRYAAAVADPGEVRVPVMLAGQALAQQRQGVEAVAEVSRLHGKDFPLVSGAMAVYGNGAATVWVSGAPARLMAAQMVRAMAEKIAEGRSPFTPLATRDVPGRAVYELAGMGQRHFYFQSGAQVVWLAVDEAVAEQALADILSFYP